MELEVRIRGLMAMYHITNTQKSTLNHVMLILNIKDDGQIQEQMQFVKSSSDRASKRPIRRKQLMEHVPANILPADYAVIAGDGHCLFATIVHQLDNVIINSSQHNDSTHELRQEVVEYLKGKRGDGIIEMNLASNYCEAQHFLR